ncbi:unnamed protein product [Mytilus edulis]|uniref:Uncharacterized protein n=1 Tax=Mytilus edulis TaxID=6550 RepID=A0A8S3QYB0_MYTED|nr:unnamed protein product [Mytilus edulis]
MFSDCKKISRRSGLLCSRRGRAITDIQLIIDELNNNGSLTNQQAKNYNDILLQTKKYLKSDYKIHIKEESNVAYHCRKFALSDAKNVEYQDECTHIHDHICQDSWSFLRNWKSHIVRARNQDCAKSKILDNLGQNDIFIVLDWAMKYLPRRYREDQSNWFCKRGISWHISVSFIKEQNITKSLAFIHIFEGQIPQDSSNTTAVILDTVDTIQKNPNITKVHLYSDNAGCYKSTETINALHQSGKIATYDFCEAQDEKGSCDRTAATVKCAVKRYINQGNDVLNAVQLKKAIEQSTKNVKYHVKVVDSVLVIPKHDMKKTSIPSISAINNFQFDSTGIHTWKAFNIGPGKHIQIDSNIIPTIMIKEDSCDIPFHSLNHHSNTSSRTEISDGTFSCQNEECILSFPTYESMEGHMLIGDCQLRLPDRSSVDVVKTTYLEKLHATNSLPILMDCVSSVCHDIKLSKGWAMKEERKCKRFNDKQKNILLRNLIKV